MYGERTEGLGLAISLIDGLRFNDVVRGKPGYVEVFRCLHRISSMLASQRNAQSRVIYMYISAAHEGLWGGSPSQTTESNRKGVSQTT